MQVKLVIGVFSFILGLKKFKIKKIYIYYFFSFSRHFSTKSFAQFAYISMTV